MVLRVLVVLVCVLGSLFFLGVGAYLLTVAMAHITAGDKVVWSGVMILISLPCFFLGWAFLRDEMDEG